jgi:hypothetical protein
MATIKELAKLFEAHQKAESVLAAKVAEDLKLKMHQQAEDVADLIIQAVTFTPFVKFPEDMFRALFKASLEVFEYNGVVAVKDRINNNLRDLMALLEAIDPRMDPEMRASAVARLTAPVKKEVGVPRYADRPRKADKKKSERKPEQEGNATARAYAKALAEKAAKDAAAKANGGLPEGAVDLTATV